MEKYQRIKIIGSGSYGVVYEALNKRNEEVVAIKKLKEKHRSMEDCLELREVKSLRKLHHHPNIVKLLEIVKENNTVYLVFEYMECSLHRRMINRKEPFSESEIRDLCFQVFQGLAYMHNSGYFHRDLKPENLLVSKDVIKLADFGQAREINGKAPFTDYITTRWYRAPEVLLYAQAYGPAVDMWAMGAIMAELFTLQPLFRGDTAMEVMYRICSVIGSPTPATWCWGHFLASPINYQFPQLPAVYLSEVVPSASPDALNLISTLLSWDPCLRPTAMEALEHPFFYSCYPVPPSLSTRQKIPAVFKLAMEHELSKPSISLKSCPISSKTVDSTDDMIHLLPKDLLDSLI